MSTSSQLYRDVLDCTTSGVVALKAVRDPETGEIVDFEWILTNAYADRVTGRAEGELVGKRLLDELPGHRTNGYFDRYRRVIETGAPEEYTVDFADRGAEGIARVRVAKLGDGVAVAFVDITRETEQRHAFEVIAERLSIATRSAGIGVWEQNLDTGETMWDETTYRILGVDPSEAAGLEPWRRAVHPDDFGKVMQGVDAAADGGPGGASPTLNARYRVIWPDGSTHHVQSHARLVASEGGRRMVGVNWDETEAVEAAEELEIKRREAEAANIAKSQFLAVMSHEIRTPLNGVLGMAALLANTQLDESQHKMLKTIEESGDELLDILNTILDLSRIEAGRIELEETEFDLIELLRRARALFAPQAEEKGLTFRVEATARARGRLVGDPTRVRQVLYNLLSNAVKFTHEGGIVLSADIAPRRDGGPAHDLVLKVRDTGVGVAPDKLERIFDAFTQADGSMTRRFGGAGLGLTVAAQLAAILGGSISVESKQDEGSTFIARLRVERPIADAAPAPRGRDQAAAPAAEERRLRVLAAEDSPTNQLVLKGVLQGCGADATVVENGLEAIEAWAVEGFDLILLDIQMPVMDGVAAAREIRRLEAENGRPHTPILAVSANAMPHQVEAYLAAGFDEHIAKPVKPGELVAAISRHVGGGTEAEGVSPAAAKLGRNG